jgi:uncharacterized lipoprotein YddW (UPF0748 family)
MKFLFTVLSTLLLITNTTFAQSGNEEFRSTWVITWEYINASSNVETNKARIRKVLDDHKKANMTSVLWQVRQAGTAYYNSSYEPYGSYAGGTYPGFDPLAYAIEEAHKRGLELHAWFNVFACASTAPGTPAQVNPDWVCRDQSGIPMTANRALSPGLPAVREYLKKVAMEIVRNYDIDGFHYDYVRWNEYSSDMDPIYYPKYADEKASLLDGDIPDEMAEKLESSAGRYLYDVLHPFSAGVPAGYSSWPQFWRASVTTFVKDMADSVRAVKPWVRISAAAIGKYNWSSWQGYDVVYQDAALWFNEGYIDQLTPMHYHWTTAAGFTGMLSGSCPQCWGQFLQPGIAAKRLFTVGPGSYILSENNVWNNHPSIIEASRNVPWTDGFQFFSYGSWRDKDYFPVAGNTFFSKKTKIRASKFLLDTIPDAPIVSIQKIDSLRYNITVTPPQSSGSLNQWFILYRSESTFNAKTTPIVEVKFGNTPFTITETFTGTQNFNGKYKYAATMADRYWNESLFSNITETDPIPSFPPVVLTTHPAPGDTVDINARIEINFSKSIVPSSLNNALTINPSVTFTTTLTDNNRKLTIIPSSALSFATTYIVTVDTSVKDVNGVALDGNKDGIPGDPYAFTFSTIEQDNVGPDVISTYPANSEADFDVENVINILFSERVDITTINHSNVELRVGDQLIIKDMHLRNAGNASVLSMKTIAPFQNEADYSVTLKTGIKDLNNNPMSSDKIYSFSTSGKEYTVRTLIDDFTTETNTWMQPTFSGSTVGVINANCSFSWETTHSLPATSPAKSAYLKYEWNPAASTKLLRNYLAGGAPRDVVFDTSYILQVYIFGDGSGTRFRFALDEDHIGNWPDHEVSIWFTIDWYGWRLVEWDLADPSMVGTWLSNGGVMNGTRYRMDSFQLTDSPGSAVSGGIYFDNLRAVKKQQAIIVSSEDEELIPGIFTLHQNFPNPFNPSTVISFELQKAGFVNLEVYNILGQKISTLISEDMSAGYHQVSFDAGALSSGKYIYRLWYNDEQQTKIMMFMK